MNKKAIQKTIAVIKAKNKSIEGCAQSDEIKMLKII